MSASDLGCYSALLPYHNGSRDLSVGKRQIENLGQFEDVLPLSHFEKPTRKRYMADVSPVELEAHQGLRIWQDLRAFLPIRYPTGRNIVFAKVFLVWGATYAKRAGLTLAETLAFVEQESQKVS